MSDSITRLALRSVLKKFMLAFINDYNAYRENKLNEDDIRIRGTKLFTIALDEIEDIFDIE